MPRWLPCLLLCVIPCAYNQMGRCGALWWLGRTAQEKKDWYIKVIYLSPQAQQRTCGRFAGTMWRHPPPPGPAAHKLRAPGAPPPPGPAAHELRAPGAPPPPGPAAHLTSPQAQQRTCRRVPGTMWRVLPLPGPAAHELRAPGAPPPPGPAAHVTSLQAQQRTCRLLGPAVPG